MRVRAKGKRKPRPPGEMNGLETAYAKHLDELLHNHKILWWVYEGLKFRLAKNTTYTPDFTVMLPDGTIELHETKGWWKDDARVKIKMAAELFPFQFVGVTRRPKKEGGGWEYEEF